MYLLMKRVQMPEIISESMHGYAIRGLAPQNKRLLSRGQRVNAIAGMSTDGVVAVEVTKSNVDAEVFFDYARRSLIPNMHATIQRI